MRPLFESSHIEYRESYDLVKSCLITQFELRYFQINDSIHEEIAILLSLQCLGDRGLHSVAEAAGRILLQSIACDDATPCYTEPYLRDETIYYMTSNL